MNVIGWFFFLSVEMGIMLYASVKYRELGHRMVEQRSLRASYYGTIRNNRGFWKVQAKIDSKKCHNACEAAAAAFMCEL